MKIEFMMRCCCQDRFKRLYGKLMRDVKRQVGRKKFHELAITGTEEVAVTLYNADHPSWSKYPVCQTCQREYRKKHGVNTSSIHLQEFTIKIEG